MSLVGKILARGDDGYEEVRVGPVFNERKPDRYPELIVLAETEQDVVDAVHLARERGLKVKARAGGHSWTASGVREGMLVDVARLTEISLDTGTRTAQVGPGTKGRDLNELLREHQLFFPGGHCPTVGLGGFLLQGGWGWNSRKLGPACLSVRGVDVVTGDGELIHASETENPDVLWAARGAGPGFFGIVTRFHLTLHERPQGMLGSYYVYPLELVEDVLRWAMEIADDVDPAVEAVILGTTPRLPEGGYAEGGTQVILAAAALLETEGQAREALQILETCPVRDRALVADVAGPRTMPELYAGADALEPEGHRWAVDNLWTDDGPDTVVPLAAELFRSVPNDVSHIFWFPWHEQEIPNAALSVYGKLYVAAFAGWHDPAEDERMLAWPVEQMRKLAHISKGIQLADENLVARRDRYLSDAASSRLEALRAQWDPDGRFHSYLIAPA